MERREKICELFPPKVGAAGEGDGAVASWKH